MKKYLILLAALFALFSCDVKLPETTDFAVAPESLTAKAEGGSLSLAVYSDGNVTATLDSSCDWARITSGASIEGDGEIEIQVDENPAMKRTTNVTVVYKGGVLEKVIPLTQNGTKAYIEVAEDDVRVDGKSEKITEVGLRTNIPAASLNATLRYLGDQKDWISDVVFTSDKMSFATPVGFDTPQQAEIVVSYTDDIVGTLSVTVSVLLSDKDGYYEAGPHTEIKTASELEHFLSLAASLDADAAYTLGADIDLKDVALTSAESYKGSLSGNGHKLINWTATAPLFKTLSGSVSDLVIDASCKYNVSEYDNVAFVAAHNSGTVRNCVNNAPISCTGKYVFPNSRSIAAIVAVNDGVVSGCVNNGTVDIVSEGFYQAALWLGGVVGKTSASAAELTSVKECTNNGKLSLTVDRCKSPTFIGGVVGGTPADTVKTLYISEGMKDYGVISGCTNTAAVTVTWNEMAVPVLNANIGGVIGYLQGTLTSCENKGALSFDIPSTGETPLKHTSLGGVAGFVLKSVTRCNNSGTVSVKGLLGGGTVGDSMGTSYYPGTLLGGVVGMAGPNDGTCVIEECNNNGVLDFQPQMVASGKPIYFVGGIVGYGKAPIQNCNNTKAVTLKSNCKNKYLGGIVGQSSYEVVSCTNSGTITLDNVVKENDSDFSLVSYLGGISAYHAVDAASKKISLCSNSGEINYLNGPAGATNINYVGGIAGLSLGEVHGGSTDSRCFNSGNINYLGTTRCYVGGICGQTAAKILWMDNSGSITATGASNAGIANSSMVGGFVGVASHSLDATLDGGTKTKYGVGSAKAGYTGNQTGNVTAVLADGSTGTGVGLVFGKLNAAGSVKTAPDGTAVNGFCNYHSATVSGALSVTGGSTIKAAIFAGAGFGTYGSAPVGIIFGIESGHSKLKAPISVNGVTITADNYKDYLAYGANENVITTYMTYEN